MKISKPVGVGVTALVLAVGGGIGVGVAVTGGSHGGQDTIQVVDQTGSLASGSSSPTSVEASVAPSVAATATVTSAPAKKTVRVAGEPVPTAAPPTYSDATPSIPPPVGYHSDGILVITSPPAG